MITYKKIYFMVAIAVLFLSASGALAAKLDDFNAAAGNIGCNSIPYADLREQCEKQQEQVHKWCDGGAGPVSLAKGVSSNLKRDLENEKRRYEDLRRKKSDLETALSRSDKDDEKTKLKNEITATEKDIYDSDKAVDRIKDDLDKRNDLVQKVIYNIEKCIDYRQAVMNVFGYALDKVRNENEDVIQPIARSLRAKYEESKRGHEIAITDRNNALSNAKDERV